MTIVFPMAGLSSRFFKAGYKVPKYMLDLNGYSVFYHAVNGFSHYFETCKFLFIHRNIDDTRQFIEDECYAMGIKNYQCVQLSEPTDGQAETVYMGLEEAGIQDNERLLIFNIDTFRPGYRVPETFNLEEIDGYLEVFEGEGEHWSFVLPDSSNRVVRTTEKERISNLCSSGLYYFRRTEDYKTVFRTIRSKNDATKNEFYIAPMYNYLIEDNKDIRFFTINANEIVLCGTPEDYQKLKK